MLTPEERELAAARAEVYPPEWALSYFVGVKIGDGLGASNLLAERPELAEAG